MTETLPAWQFATGPANRRWTDIFIWLYILALVFFSVYYATERIAAYDTAGYLREMILTRGFYMPTNRFAGLITQVLPVAGILAGIPLTLVIILYSLNFSLIPIAGALICRYRLKDPVTAIALLLFYSLAAAKLFYYPVSEFQTGLCILLVYHALFQRWVQNGVSTATVLLWTLPVITTVIFSHPLSIVVLLCWAAWMFCWKSRRKALLVAPVATGLLAYWLKHLFFTATTGAQEYEQGKLKNLDHFSQPLSSFFEGNLLQQFLKEYAGQYFMAIVLLLASIVILAAYKKWLPLLALVLIITGCCLLTSVSFQQESYNFYYEHLYQAVPFFIVLGFMAACSKPNLKFGIIMTLLVGTGIISFAKINAGSQHNREKIAFYKPYIDFMRRHQIKKAALPKRFVPGNFDSYWASSGEVLLISGQQGPDSAVAMYIHWTPESIKLSGKERGYLSPSYFRILKAQNVVVLDSIASPQQIDSLNKISNHNPTY